MVAADSVYGVGELEMALRRGEGYVLGVHGNHGFRSWSTEIPVAGEAQEIAKALPASIWQPLSAGHGIKGDRLYDWTYLRLADLDAADYDAAVSGLWTRGLLIRRSMSDGELAYFTTWCPKGTPVETLVRVEGVRWRIEEGFETAKNEFGLDHNETRSWHGWHRHVSMVMLGYALMAAARSQAKRHRAEKNDACSATKLIRWSIQEIRRLAVKLAQRRIGRIHPASTTGVDLAWSLG